MASIGAMIKIINYADGAVQMNAENGVALRLERDAANRLVMAARMHGVGEFIHKIPNLIPDVALANLILAEFADKNPSERWTLKEKFARLTTVTKEYACEEPNAIQETVELAI